MLVSTKMRIVAKRKWGKGRGEKGAMGNFLQPPFLTDHGRVRHSVRSFSRRALGLSHVAVYLVVRVCNIVHCGAEEESTT